MTALSPATTTAKEGRLRVLQCITRLGLGGAERVAISIICGLREEIDFAVFTVHEGHVDEVGRAMRRELEEAGVALYSGTSVPMKAGGMIPGGISLGQAIRRFRPTVIHYHSETPEACGAAMTVFSPAEARIGSVRTIHNSVFWRYWPRIGRWCDKRLSRAHIACVSEAARDEFLRYRAESGASRPPSEPAIIYNGVNLEPLVPRAQPLHEKVRRVLFAGRFEFQKGADILGLALPQVRLPAGIHAELCFVGHGTQEPYLRSLAAQPPAGWTIQLRPPTAGLTSVFPEFDVVVVPSRFEGLGLVAIEAILNGCPVVLTDAPGLRETTPLNYPWRARAGDAADLARQLSAALSETEKWRPALLSAQALAREKFSPAGMLCNYRALYAVAAG